VYASLHPTGYEHYSLPVDQALVKANTYVYEEASDPEQFFVPHTWRICMQTSFADLPWYLERVCLLDTVSTGLAEDMSLLVAGPPLNLVGHSGEDSSSSAANMV
jgi:hypothetical protein